MNSSHHEMFQAAKRMYSNGIYESAYTLTQLLVSSFTASRDITKLNLKVDAYLLLGDIYSQTKETNRALECYQKIRTISGKKMPQEKSYELSFKISQCLFELRMYENALSELESIPELDRLDSVWNLLAKINEILEDVPAAIYCYKVLLDKNPSAISIITRLFELGLVKHEMDSLLNGRLPSYLTNYVESLGHQQKYDYKQELACLKDFYRKHLNNTFILSRLANCQFNLGNAIEAYKYYKKMDTLEPKAVEYKDSYSLILYQASKVTELESLANRVSKDGPHRKECWIVLARLELINKNVETAGLYASKALELDQGYSHGHLLLATIQMQMQIYDQAILHFRKANLLCNDIQSLEGILEAYLSQNQTVSALEICSRVFKRAHVPRTMTLMAIVIGHLPNRQNEAKTLLKTVLSVNPNCIEAVLAYSNVLSREKLYQEAISLLETQLISQPCDFIYSRIASLCLDNEDTSKAMEYYNTALSMNPECVTAQEGLAKVEKILNGTAEDDEDDLHDHEEGESMNEESMEEL